MCTHTIHTLSHTHMHTRGQGVGNHTLSLRAIFDYERRRSQVARLVAAQTLDFGRRNGEGSENGARYMYLYIYVYWYINPSLAWPTYIHLIFWHVIYKNWAVDLKYWPPSPKLHCQHIREGEDQGGGRIGGVEKGMKRGLWSVAKDACA